MAAIEIPVAICDKNYVASSPRVSLPIFNVRLGCVYVLEYYYTTCYRDTTAIRLIITCKTKYDVPCE